VTGLQKAAAPARAWTTHWSAWVYAAHVAACTWVSHCEVEALSGQWKQLSAVQSAMHALLWLQVASTNGATHVRIPIWSTKSKSNCFKQVAHAVFEQPKKLSHEAVLALAPAEQACAAF